MRKARSLAIDEGNAIREGKVCLAKVCLVEWERRGRRKEVEEVGCFARHRSEVPPAFRREILAHDQEQCIIAAGCTKTLDGVGIGGQNMAE